MFYLTFLLSHNFSLVSLTLHPETYLTVPWTLDLRLSEIQARGAPALARVSVVRYLMEAGKVP